MILAKYLAERRIRRSHFALLVNVSASTITSLCKGEQWPSRDLAQRIAEQTGGLVTANDFAQPVNRKRRA
jgi:plasmid maintenance system antidote protein VapI